MNPTYDFRGQVALVTGASSGIGLAAAQAFAECGVSVVLADIDEVAVDATAHALTSAGHDVIGVACGVFDEAQVATLVPRVSTKFGGLDSLVREGDFRDHHLLNEAFFENIGKGRVCEVWARPSAGLPNKLVTMWTCG